MEEDVKTSHHCVTLMLLIAWFAKHSENLFNWHILQESVTDLVRSKKTVIPIDWLWLMDDSGLLSITKYLFYPHTQQENNKLNEFSKQVIDIFSSGNPKEEHIKMLQSDIVIWLVSSGFSSQKMKISINKDYCKKKHETFVPMEEDDQSFEQLPCQNVLLQLILWSCNVHQNIVSNIIQAITSSRLSIQVIKQSMFFIARSLIFQRDGTTLAYAIEHQPSYNLQRGGFEKYLIAIVLEILIPLSLEDVNELLFYLVDSIVQEYSKTIDQNVKYAGLVAQCTQNWTILMLIVSAVINCFKESSTVVKDIIDKLLINCLEADNNGVFTFMVLMVICRQASQEGKPGVFQSYGLWFAQTFGEENNPTISKSKKRMENLIKYLTHMVPFETQHCLRAHLSRPPWLSPHMRQTWGDYSVLVRTRLSDINASKQEEWLSYDQPIFNGTACVTARCDEMGSKRTTEVLELNWDHPVMVDVEKALDSFQNTKKVPQIILEASMFRRPYFVGQFLPALLSIAKKLKNNTEIKKDKFEVMKDFVSCLQSKGKIPSSLLIELENSIDIA